MRDHGGKRVNRVETPSGPREFIEYIALPVRCSCSQTGLREAARYGLEASNIYTLHVGSDAYYDGKDAAAAGMDHDNPFSPHINLVIEVALARWEWYLTDEHGNACGSEGC